MIAHPLDQFAAIGSINPDAPQLLACAIQAGEEHAATFAPAAMTFAPAAATFAPAAATFAPAAATFAPAAATFAPTAATFAPTAASVTYNRQT